MIPIRLILLVLACILNLGDQTCHTKDSLLDVLTFKASANIEILFSTRLFEREKPSYTRSISSSNSLTSFFSSIPENSFPYTCYPPSRCAILAVLGKERLIRTRTSSSFKRRLKSSFFETLISSSLILKGSSCSGCFILFKISTLA